MDTSDRKIVIVDLDDTLHEFSHTVALVALNEFGHRIDAAPTEWHLGLHPITDDSLASKIFQRCHDKDYIFLTKPYPGSVMALTEISNMGYEVHYFTDRKNDAAVDTEDWLRLHGFPNPHYLMCCGDKREEMLRLKDHIVTVIDDRPRTQFFTRTELGCEHVFSMKHSHNQSMSDIPGVHLLETWDDILESFIEHMTVKDDNDDNIRSAGTGI